jgi:hypothetical protein
MKALLVYESLFGNTEAVARAIADGLSLEMEVAVHEVGEAPTVITEFIDLVVVGGPTHAFSLSRPGTRVEPCGRVRPRSGPRPGCGSGSGTPWGRALGEDLRARHDGRAPLRRT